MARLQNVLMSRIQNVLMSRLQNMLVVWHPAYSISDILHEQSFILSTSFPRERKRAGHKHIMSPQLAGMINLYAQLITAKRECWNMHKFAFHAIVYVYKWTVRGWRFYSDRCILCSFARPKPYLYLRRILASYTIFYFALTIKHSTEPRRLLR